MSLMRIITLVAASGLTSPVVVTEITLDAGLPGLPIHVLGLLRAAAAVTWIAFAAAHCRDMALRHNDARHREAIDQIAEIEQKLQRTNIDVERVLGEFEAAYATDLRLAALRRREPTPRPNGRSSYLRTVDPA